MTLSEQVHFWKHGNIGEAVVTTDLGLGHESSGVIIKTGSNVKHLAAGDRVAIECGVPCMRPECDYCRTGRYNGCSNIVFYSSPPVDGTLRRYHVHPAAWLHRLPNGISYEEGALLEPLSVALAGIDRSGLRLGDALVICGAGPIGMVVLLAAHAAGAGPIVITDIDENRLKIAKSLVPRVRTVQVRKEQDAKDVALDIKQALGQEAKLVIECTGMESSIHAGIYVSYLSRIHEDFLTYRCRLLDLAAKFSSSESEASHFMSIPSCTHHSERSISNSSFDIAKLIRRRSCSFQKA